ncbi:MAG: NADP-dependent isocitrate dehydrogenase [Clostridia bacterium]|nr:NADP-dependent isocitrate dehydrogenase [Clostridia bacterium]
MKKIQMINPIVEIDGDEMTRILWEWIKDILIKPYIELNTEYYDLSLVNRENTKDQISKDAAFAIKKYKVGVKCATITPNAQRVKEYNLTQMWKSPNGTLRSILDGTVFRYPIIVNGINPLIPTWTKPITIARHAYGDVYSGVEEYIDESKLGKVVLKFSDGSEKIIFDFKDNGIVQSMHNTDKSIINFAKSCFNYALSTKTDLWFSAKDTISKIYDHRFKDIFFEIYENEYKEKFIENNISFFYTLIDDAVSRIVKSNGGMIWACKNYDGDVMSDMVATAYGSLAMMASVLVSPNGDYEYEAAHGTVTRHYYKYKAGEETSTNSVATIFAWTGALNKRGELDNNIELQKFAKNLEKATINTIESGIMTKDLACLYTGKLVNDTYVNSKEFLYSINDNLQKLL